MRRAIEGDCRVKPLPRLLIEDWLPAAAIGVECMRERGSASALAPHTYLHVWWARRPLTVSRAAVLGSLLPADFPHDQFERLLGFGHPGQLLVDIRRRMDTGERVEGGFNCDRAFKRIVSDKDFAALRKATSDVWGADVVVIDPMAGGGSIPLESARMGFRTLANEYNPVACSVLEATVDYPFRFGADLATKTRKWAKVWEENVERRLAPYYPQHRFEKVHAYIFARTVPCPETQHQTPLVPDWHLLKPKGETGHVVAEPAADKKKGTWTIRVRKMGRGAGELREPPAPTYDDGKGVSLFTNRQIPADYIKAKAQAGEMGRALYAVAVKTTKGLEFHPAGDADIAALAAAEKELLHLRSAWEKNNVIPVELYPEVSSDERPRRYGMPRWADLFSHRQLLAFGVLADELRQLRHEIVLSEGKDSGEPAAQLLAFAIDKLLSHNSCQSRWDPANKKITNAFERHDFSFRATFAEMAVCSSGRGLAWAIDNVIEGYEEISHLPRSNSTPVEISLGSASNLPQLADGSITAAVVDPPYTDNVQYSELADFFYVWLKRTQGHRRPEWFATYLCDHDEEAVVNVSRHREEGEKSSRKGARDGRTAQAKAKAHAFYQRLMTDIFRECRRILRDDGVLTVMFTHKKQEAWEALFTSLIQAGFTITATWPVKTESEHSLHQAKKNAAQSTVILVARKRGQGAGVGYFDSSMQAEIRERARATAGRLQKEGLNPVDQLVGSFGPAIAVYSRYDEVRTDTGAAVGVDRAIEEASDAVSKWRIEQLAGRELDGVEAEGRFALLCWDVLVAAEFRFNEAKLLGHAVGMDVGQLEAAGLVTKSGDKIQMVPARDRRRERPLEADEVTETLFGPVTTTKRRKKADALKVHPNDPRFRTAYDGCQALALRYIEAGGGTAGIGSAKALARQQMWGKDSPVARLMEALIRAAPAALRYDTGKKSAAAKYPEFRAWHSLLQPLFGATPPDWTPKAVPQAALFSETSDAEDDTGEEAGEELEN